MTDSREALNAESLSVSMTVRDVKTSLAWYRDVLGFTVDREMLHEGTLRGVALQAGAVRILLNQDDGAKGANRPLGVGFSMMITTRESVDAVAARIKSNGGSLLSEPADMPWGARVFRLKDPDGYSLSISSPRR